ncbi:DRBM domain-containing protein [Aphelenchoides fujianensis]|nr:DRBM domain-containing protein [Aphelenchoides fujianensis]
MATARDLEFYANKLILAPMVKGGRTPLRCLCLDYGCNLAYTEELIDQRLLACTRIENELLGTVDFKIKDDLVLRVAKEERPKCVLQVGSCTPENLVLIAKKMSGDVAAIDVNMGCPKPFSLSGGMGAALLKKPDLVRDMLTALVSASPIPVSCKIRVHDSLNDTLQFVDMAQKCGISAIGVHGRRPNERPGDENRHSEIAEVARFASIPVIASGESSCINSYDEMLKSREKCEASSIMVAREALVHPSVFRSEGGILTYEQEICAFLQKACLYDEPFTQTKYVVQRMLGGQQEFDPRGRATVDAATVREICAAWSQEAMFNEFHEKRVQKTPKEPTVVIDPEDENRVEIMDVSIPQKRLRGASGSGHPEVRDPQVLPGSPPSAPHVQSGEEKLSSSFIASLFRRNARWTAASTRSSRSATGHFASTVAQVNKRLAEQVASLVALHGLKARDLLEGRVGGVITYGLFITGCCY